MTNKIILDAATLINTRAFPKLERSADWIMPDRVYRELRDSLSRLRVETLMAEGQLTLMSPAEKSMRKVLEHARDIGTAVSKADISVVALACEVREQEGFDNVLVVTDDYAVQNLAHAVGVRFEGATMPSISTFIRYYYACPACRNKSTTPGECEDCGTPLKRRIKKRTALPKRQL